MRKPPSSPAPKGRPTKYKPEYCDMLVEHMSEGYSYESFAAVIKVNVDSLYEWEKVNAAFSEAKKSAWGQNLLFWERKGIEGLYNYSERSSGGGSSSQIFNTTNWIFQMKNRHGWRDKKDVDMRASIDHRSDLDEIPKERIIEFLREKE